MIGPYGTSKVTLTWKKLAIVVSMAVLIASVVILVKNFSWSRLDSAPPDLLNPRHQAVMPNADKARMRPLVWEFPWSSVPGARQYHIVIVHPQADTPLVD